MIRTFEKAKRIQQRRYRSGKFGWARAVRRYLAERPGERSSLAGLVRQHEDTAAAVAEVQS